eukprot:8551398-Ditylum_brightwellii.AAC.1
MELGFQMSYLCCWYFLIFLLLLSPLRPVILDDTVVGSIPKDIKTLHPCRLCNGQSYHMVPPAADKEIYHENGTFQIDIFNCAMLLEQTQDPDQLISANACEFIGGNCVVCGSGPFQDGPPS